MSKLSEILEKCPNATLQVINGNILEASRSTKKKSAYLKIAVDDETAKDYLTFDLPDTVGFMVYFKRSDYDNALEELKQALK